MGEYPWRKTYGLQATCKAKKVAAILKDAVKQVVQGVLGLAGKVAEKLSYRERMKRAYGKDPLLYERCGTEMWLLYVWHPDHGVIYDELEQIKAGKYDVYDASRAGVENKREKMVQLSLFHMPHYAYT